MIWNIPKPTCTPRVVFPRQCVQSSKDLLRIRIANDGETVEPMKDLTDTSRVEPLVMAACYHVILMLQNKVVIETYLWGSREHPCQTSLLHPLPREAPDDLGNKVVKVFYGIDRVVCGILHHP